MGINRARISATPSGARANVPTDPLGKQVSREDCERRLPEWIPGESDHVFVHSLMQRVIEPGRMAGWIPPPGRGINNLAVDYESFRLS